MVGRAEEGGGHDKRERAGSKPRAEGEAAGAAGRHRAETSRREREGVKKVEERAQSLIVKYTKFSHCRRRRSSVAC